MTFTFSFAMLCPSTRAHFSSSMRVQLHPGMEIQFKCEQRDLHWKNKFDKNTAGRSPHWTQSIGMLRDWHWNPISTKDHISWLNGEDRPHPNTRQHPEDIRSLIRRQQQVGWQHLLQGSFAVDWGYLQAIYHEQVFPSQQYSSEKWQVLWHLSKIWEQRHQLWLSCKHQELYDKDKLSRKQLERAELHRQGKWWNQVRKNYCWRPRRLMTSIQCTSQRIGFWCIQQHSLKALSASRPGHYVEQNQSAHISGHSEEIRQLEISIVKYISFLPATHTRAVVTRVSRVLAPSNTAAAR